jgi:hypothetical protein
MAPRLGAAELMTNRPATGCRFATPTSALPRRPSKQGESVSLVLLRLKSVTQRLRGMPGLASNAMLAKSQLTTRS